MFPSDRDDFDAWVCRTVLNPCTPLFHEARHLLDEETGPLSHGACHSVLAALARGCTTHGEIATFLGQQLTDASRPSPSSATTVCFNRRRTDCSRGSSVIASRTRSSRSSTPWRVHAGPRWSKATPRPCGRTRELISTPLSPDRSSPKICREWAVRFANPDAFGADHVDGVVRLPQRPVGDGRAGCRGRGPPTGRPDGPVPFCRWGSRDGIPAWTSTICNVCGASWTDSIPLRMSATSGWPSTGLLGSAPNCMRRMRVARSCSSILTVCTGTRSRRHCEMWGALRWSPAPGCSFRWAVRSPPYGPLGPVLLVPSALRRWRLRSDHGSRTPFRVTPSGEATTMQRTRMQMRPRQPRKRPQLDLRTPSGQSMPY